MTRQEEIDIVHGGGGHVVILGAGASFASTLRNPERGGKSLPLMSNIVDKVGLIQIVDILPKELKALKNDFESLYSAIAKRPEFNEQQVEIEKAVYSYFSDMSLPAEPTIYDYLILSLRHQRDVIATFNWDPFLLQAYYRNSEFTASPGVLFLHGCVALGYDEKTGQSGPAGYTSKSTLNDFIPTRLLYPVEQKDYNSDGFINGQWEALQRNLKGANRVTVFGYSAPKTDVEAMALLQEPWGSAEERNMEQFEFIDVQDERSLVESWKGFVHSHHYNYSNDYFDSSLALHPRRTVESYHHWSRPMKYSEVFQDGNKVPDNFKTFDELWDWHRPLIEAEKKFYSIDE